MIKGLDGARGLSVLLIMLHHLHVMEFFWVSVQLFYVLSGFLITGILLRQSGTPFGEYLKNFYGRRALRIFPLYYLFLACLIATVLVLDWPATLMDGWQYIATYTYNFYFSLSGKDNLVVTHLWSLAVEEQFYLLWPLLIFFLPRRWLKPVLIGMLIAGPLLRLAALVGLPHISASNDVYHALYKLPTSHIDAFAIGALLTVVNFRANATQFLLLALAILVLGIANVVFRDQSLFNWGNMGYPLHYREPIGVMFGYSLFNIFWAALISGLAAGKIFPVVFENRLLSHIGEVSYGMYILHMPMLFLTLYAIAGNDIKPFSIPYIAINIVITYALAALLFHCYEKPILGLKGRLFPYRGRGLDMYDVAARQQDKITGRRRKTVRSSNPA